MVFAHSCVGGTVQGQGEVQCCACSRSSSEVDADLDIGSSSSGGSSTDSGPLEPPANIPPKASITFSQGCAAPHCLAAAAAAAVAGSSPQRHKGHFTFSCGRACGKLFGEQAARWSYSKPYKPPAHTPHTPHKPHTDSHHSTSSQQEAPGATVTAATAAAAAAAQADRSPSSPHVGSSSSSGRLPLPDVDAVYRSSYWDMRYNYQECGLPEPWRSQADYYPFTLHPWLQPAGPLGGPNQHQQPQQQQQQERP
jgi:hypothetical protein